MNRSDTVPIRNPKPIQPTSGITGAVLYDVIVDLGREITRQTAIAEREGDYETVGLLLREKDRIHRMRRELSYVTR